MHRIVFATLTSLLFMFSPAFAQTSTQATSNSGATFNVLRNFTGAADGCCLFGGLARDRGGNLYGVAYLSKNLTSFGDLYKLSPNSGGYTLQVLHASSNGFASCQTTPVFDSVGNLYGVCTLVGFSDGTLWEYSKQGRFSVLHTFNGTDGMFPEDSVAIDNAGNIYGTTTSGGLNGNGTLWGYIPSIGTLNVLHNFTGGADGDILPSGPRIDSSGKIWGTTEFGPNCNFCGNGTVWSYDLNSDTFTTVLDFASYPIQAPQSRLTLDPAGNLYGTAADLTQNNCGLVYELQKSNNYVPVIVYSFTGTNGDGCDPIGSVTIDSQGNIFGTTYYGGSANDGAVYELKPVNGAWQESTLHSFSISDGTLPQSGLITDGAGNWFGTTALGGNGKEGTVFEISGVN